MGLDWLATAHQRDAAVDRESEEADGGGPIGAMLRSRPPWSGRSIKPSRRTSIGRAATSSAADTLEELAGKLSACPYQIWPMQGKVLRATVERYRRVRGCGRRCRLWKPTPTYRSRSHRSTPRGTALSARRVLRHSDLIANGQVIDLQGQVSPRSLAAGENAGGMAQHGLAKCVCSAMSRASTPASSRKRRRGKEKSSGDPSAPGTLPQPSGPSRGTTGEYSLRTTRGSTAVSVSRQPDAVRCSIARRGSFEQPRAPSRSSPEPPDAPGDLPPLAPNPRHTAWNRAVLRSRLENRAPR